MEIKDLNINKQIDDISKNSSCMMYECIDSLPPCPIIVDVGYDTLLEIDLSGVNGLSPATEKDGQPYSCYVAFVICNQTEEDQKIKVIPDPGVISPADGSWKFYTSGRHSLLIGAAISREIKDRAIYEFVKIIEDKNGISKIKLTENGPIILRKGALSDDPVFASR